MSDHQLKQKRETRIENNVSGVAPRQVTMILNEARLLQETLYQAGASDHIRLVL
ncbi:MAG: hypothetical protein JRI34_03150 [Deltaproteobacteria bacterium]|nr:hypothetical protein [Deltaproteobacteria bacterium]